MSNPNYQTPYVEKSGLNRFYSKVYLFFAAGLAISGLTAYVGAKYFTERVVNMPFSFIMILWVFELVLVLVLSAQAKKNPALSIAGFLVYSFINGVTLSLTLMYYDINTVYQAFAAAAATFTAAALFGMFTKRDLSIFSRFLMISLLGVIIVTLLNIFLFRSSGLDFGISIFGVLLFTGITAYDNQMIRTYYAQAGQDNLGIAAFVALQLYLDFINLFYYFLRLFGRNN